MMDYNGFHGITTFEVDDQLPRYAPFPGRVIRRCERGDCRRHGLRRPGANSPRARHGIGRR